LTRFLDQHPELVPKLSSKFDKRRLQQSDPAIIQRHFTKVQQVLKKYSLTEESTYNLDKKGFRQAIPDRAKVICQYRERCRKQLRDQYRRREGYTWIMADAGFSPSGMTGEIATNGTRELVIAVETIFRDRRLLPPLIIYKGVAHYMGWYQHLDSLIDICNDWKFTYSKIEWNNSFLSVAWLKHIDIITKA